MSVNETGSLADPAGNPYVGPRPFDQDDAAAGRYHGREREARDLLALITRERLVLFYSQSGAGKSSLLRASLIPALRELGFDVLPIARVSGAQDAPAANPFLYNLILSLNEGLPPEQQSATETLSADLARLSLARYLGGAPAAAATDPATDPAIDPAIDAAGAELAPAVLLIDQFEEIITSYPNRWQERRAFFEQLRDAMQQIPRLWVVLTLREEYVGPLEPYAELMPNRLRARYYMQRMGVEAALEAVSKPAAIFGRPFAPGVAETLVDNLRSVRVPPLGEPELGQYVEPVQLQVVCHRLWHQVTQASAAAASAAGVPPEEATGAPAITAADLPLDYIDQALTWFYRDALASALAGAAVIAAGVDESELRRWFDREAITVGGIRNSVLRDEGGGRTGSLPNAAVDALLRRYLLRAELRAGAAWVELVHDRFVEPIRDDNAAWFPQHMNALQRQAILWRDEGRRPGLLLEGRLLQEAAQWAAAHPTALEPIDKEFLAACERQAANQRRARWFALAALAVGVLLLAGLLALQTYLRRVEAEQQAELLQAQKDIAEAEEERANTAARAVRQAEEAAENARQQNLGLVMQTQRASEAMRAAQAAEQRALDLADVAQSRQLAAESARLLAAGEVEGALLAAVEADAITGTVESGTALGLALAAPPPPRILSSGSPKNFSLNWMGDGTRVLMVEPQYAADGSRWEGYDLRLLDAAGGATILHLPLAQQYGWNEAGTELLAADGDGIGIWRAQDGELRLQFPASSRGVRWFQWSEDEGRVLAVAGDGAAYIWDAATGAELLRVARPGEPFASAMWNAGESRLLTWAESGAVRIWDAATGRQVSNPGGAAGSASWPVWSLDGERLLTADEAGLLTIWDAATGDKVQELRGAGAPIAFSAWDDGDYIRAYAEQEGWHIWRAGASEPAVQLPNDRGSLGVQLPSDLGRVPYVLAANEDGSVAAWDVRSGTKRFTVQQAGSPLFSPDESRFLAWDPNGVRVYSLPDGQLLAETDSSADGIIEAQWLPVTGDIITFHSDGSLRLWGGRTGELRAHAPVTTFFGDLYYSPYVEQSDDGARLAVVAGDGVVRVWDIQPETQLATLQDATGAYWQKGDTQVLTWSESGAVALWEAAGARLVQIDAGQADLYSVSMTDDERQIVVRGESALQIWDAASGAQRLHVDGVRTICWGSDGSHIATAGADGFLRIWNLARAEEAHAFAVEVDSCELSRDGSRLAAWAFYQSGGPQPIRVWDVATGTEIAAIEREAFVSRATGNGDMTRLLVGGSYLGDVQRVTLWDVEGNRGLERWNGYAAWNDNGTQALVNETGGGAGVWDATDGRALHRWPEAHSARWVLDDTAVAGSAADGVITLWDAATGAQRLALPGHALRKKDSGALNENDYGFRLAWSADRRRILTSDASSMLRIWDASSGALLDQLPSPAGFYSTFMLDSTGRRLLISDEGGTLLRDVDARRDLLRLDAVSVALPDAEWRRLLVTGQDGSVQIIPIEPGEWAAAACAHTSRNLASVEWQRLLPGDPYRPTCPGALIPPDVVEGVRREAAALLAGGNEAAARRRVDELNGWLAQSHQAEQFGLDFAALAEP